MSRWPHLISFSLFQPIFFFYRFLSTFHCKSLCITLTWGLCHLCLINTIKIMSRTAHFSKDASCSSSKSGSGCSSSESWFLSAWAAWRDWQFYCFGPSLLRSLSHTSHRRASFHLPAPSPVPRLVLISEPRVCEGVSVRVCARVDERKYKADGKKQCMKTESRREMKRTEGLKEMMKSTAGVRSLQSSLPLWAVFLQRLPSFSSYCLHVAQNKSTDTYAQSSSAFKPDTTAACLWFCVCVRVRRYYVWRVDWSIWSWRPPRDQWSRRCRTSSRVTLRRCGCLSSCHRQSLQSDRSTSPRWVFMSQGYGTHLTNP